MASLVTTVRERKRRRCLKCKQELSHCAYIRHQNPAVCPERGFRNVPREDAAASSTENTDSVITPQHQFITESEDAQASDDCMQGAICDVAAHDAPISEHSESEMCDNLESSCESESECESPEYISDGEAIDVLSGSDCEDLSAVSNEHSFSTNADLDVRRDEMKRVAVHICMFLSFFQLCYRLSERGVSLLLVFLRALLSWLCSLCPQSADIKTLHDLLPQNVYFLRKLLGKKSEITSFVVCPKCHSLYNYKDCIVTHSSGITESSKCVHIQYPNHPQLFRRTKCNTLLLKHVKYGSTTKLIPRKVYAYQSLKYSLTKLFSQPTFVQKCELWRNKPAAESSSIHFSDVFDGKVWQDFQVVNGRPFLKLPNNLCLKLNLDWFNPFKHIQYSVGVLYFVVENLPRTERYRLENVIIIGCIPGPKEPKKHVNPYLKPLVDELLELWDGKLLRTSSLFGIVPVRCALTCITCDLPATRKLCGFLSFSASKGCSKCRKHFPCEQFGEKVDYSGFDRDEWPQRSHEMHLQHVSEVQEATTASRQNELEKMHGVRYSELLRLPYFDIIEYHVVDPMHNILLGTGKHMMSIWKDQGILSAQHFDLIQEKVDKMQVPTKIGRIPYKIASNMSSFTADQLKNWICVYSLYCLHSVLPTEHYSCWVLFVEACCYLLKPCITLQELERADENLVEFCKAFETLYGKENCTPNMHMHLHLKQSVFNYGPVYGFWCFPFERFNGILGSFQKNWVSPELQMFRKFLTYQDLLLSDVPATLPKELGEFFQLQLGKHGEVSVSEGSVEQSHIDPIFLSEYQNNTVCALPLIDGTEKSFHKVHRRYEKIFNHSEVSWLTDVYQLLYPESEIGHVPMIHEQFHEVTILGERFLSKHAKGSHSSAVCAYWPAVGGGVSPVCDQLRVGVIQHFIRHTVQLNSSSQQCVATHIFALVHWHRVHPREKWFHPRILVISSDMLMNGPAVFLPLSRIFAPCAIISDKIKFDYGDDDVLISTILSQKFCV